MTADRQAAIATRAHQIWEAAGHPHGQDEQHWLQAEREIGETETRTVAIEQFNAEPVEIAPAKPVRKRVAKAVQPATEVLAAPALKLSS